MQDAAALQSLCTVGKGPLPLDAALINSGGREGRGGGRLQGQRACTCFPRRQDAECGSCTMWLPVQLEAPCLSERSQEPGMWF